MANPRFGSELESLSHGFSFGFIGEKKVDVKETAPTGTDLVSFLNRSIQHKTRLRASCFILAFSPNRRRQNHAARTKDNYTTSMRARRRRRRCAQPFKAFFSAPEIRLSRTKLGRCVIIQTGKMRAGKSLRFTVRGGSVF